MLSAPACRRPSRRRANVLAQIHLVTDQGDLDACFAIRRAVFIEEQQIPEAEEWDAFDETARHLLARSEGAPAGTARIILQGAQAKIGRVAVLREFRATGLGRALMQAGLGVAHDSGCETAILDAQTYAAEFYARLGFVAEGEPFDDGSGILHIRMRKHLISGA